MAFLASGRGGLRFATRAVGSYSLMPRQMRSSLCVWASLAPGPTVGLTTRQEVPVS